MGKQVEVAGGGLGGLRVTKADRMGYWGASREDGAAPGRMEFWGTWGWSGGLRSLRPKQKAGGWSEVMRSLRAGWNGDLRESSRKNGG